MRVHEFAEPYAARIICLLLGLPQDHWPQVARWADDLGASFSIDVGNQVPKIEAALTRIDDNSYGYCIETGDPISLRRLDARPIATLSVEAQERHERRERIYRDE